jgi:hypothetical protein
MADTGPVLDMVNRCSRETLFHRFHGPGQPTGYIQSQLAERPQDEVLAAWDCPMCVGFGVLAADDAGTWHLGVLVEDARQRQGIGSCLTAALMARASARQLDSVHADVLSQDHFILHLLRRVGPLRVTLATGTYSIDVALHGPR